VSRKRVRAHGHRAAPLFERPARRSCGGITSRLGCERDRANRTKNTRGREGKGTRVIPHSIRDDKAKEGRAYRNAVARHAVLGVLDDLLEPALVALRRAVVGDLLLHRLADVARAAREVGLVVAAREPSAYKTSDR
jgi:hypothetical protein